MFKRRKLVIFFSAAFLALFALVSFVRRQYVVPILMYHSVNPQAQPQNRLAVSVETFRRQMHFLKSRKYNVLPLQEVAALIRENKKIPPKTVSLTFDDGYKDNYTYAFPILKEYGLRATLFIIVNEVGRSQADRLSWDEIKQMQASGIISFGSHCLGPEPLINLKSPGEIRKEIFDSKKILEEKLGRDIVAFSYPEGRFNPQIKQLVIEAGYQVAVATNPGKKYSNKDTFALKRLRISESAKSEFVFWIEASGFYNFIRENRHK